MLGITIHDFSCLYKTEIFVIVEMWISIFSNMILLYVIDIQRTLNVIVIIHLTEQ